jgi:GxxExxY protein
MDRHGHRLLEGAITGSIIDCFRDVHRELGFGYRELIYTLALERDLVAKGHRVDRDVAVMVYILKSGYSCISAARPTFTE